MYHLTSTATAEALHKFRTQTLVSHRNSMPSEQWAHWEELGRVERRRRRAVRKQLAAVPSAKLSSHSDYQAASAEAEPESGPRHQRVHEPIRDRRTQQTGSALVSIDLDSPASKRPVAGSTRVASHVSHEAPRAMQPGTGTAQESASESHQPATWPSAIKISSQDAQHAASSSVVSGASTVHSRRSVSRGRGVQLPESPPEARKLESAVPAWASSMDLNSSTRSIAGGGLLPPRPPFAGASPPSRTAGAHGCASQSTALAFSPAPGYPHSEALVSVGVRGQPEGGGRTSLIERTDAITAAAAAKRAAAPPPPSSPDRMNSYHRHLGIAAPSASRQSFQYHNGHEKPGWTTQGPSSRGGASSASAPRSRASSVGSASSADACLGIERLYKQQTASSARRAARVATEQKGRHARHRARSAAKNDRGAWLGGDFGDGGSVASGRGGKRPPPRSRPPPAQRMRAPRASSARHQERKQPEHDDDADSVWGLSGDTASLPASVASHAGGGGSHYRGGRAGSAPGQGRAQQQHSSQHERTPPAARASHTGRRHGHAHTEVSVLASPEGITSALGNLSLVARQVADSLNNSNMSGVHMVGSSSPPKGFQEADAGEEAYRSAPFEAGARGLHQSSPPPGSVRAPPATTGAPPIVSMSPVLDAPLTTHDRVGVLQVQARLRDITQTLEAEQGTVAQLQHALTQQAAIIRSQEARLEAAHSAVVQHAPSPRISPIAQIHGLAAVHRQSVTLRRQLATLRAAAVGGIHSCMAGAAADGDAILGAIHAFAKQRPPPSPSRTGPIEALLSAHPRANELFAQLEAPPSRIQPPEGGLRSPQLAARPSDPPHQVHHSPPLPHQRAKVPSAQRRSLEGIFTSPRRRSSVSPMRPAGGGSPTQHTHGAAHGPMDSNRRYVAPSVAPLKSPPARNQGGASLAGLHVPPHARDASPPPSAPKPRLPAGPKPSRRVSAPAIPSPTVAASRGAARIAAPAAQDSGSPVSTSSATCAAIAFPVGAAAALETSSGSLADIAESHLEAYRGGGSFRASPAEGGAASDSSPPTSDDDSSSPDGSPLAPPHSAGSRWDSSQRRSSADTVLLSMGLQPRASQRRPKPSSPLAAAAESPAGGLHRDAFDDAASVASHQGAQPLPAEEAPPESATFSSVLVVADLGNADPPLDPFQAPVLPVDESHVLIWSSAGGETFQVDTVAAAGGVFDEGLDRESLPGGSKGVTFGTVALHTKLLKPVAGAEAHTGLQHAFDGQRAALFLDGPSAEAKSAFLFGTPGSTGAPGFLLSLIQWLWKLARRSEKLLGVLPSVRVTAVGESAAGLRDVLAAADNPAAVPGGVSVKRSSSGATFPHGATPVLVQDGSEMLSLVQLLQQHLEEAPLALDARGLCSEHLVFQVDIRFEAEHMMQRGTYCLVQVCDRQAADQGGSLALLASAMRTSQAVKAFAHCGVKHALWGGAGLKGSRLTHLLRDFLGHCSHTTWMALLRADSDVLQGNHATAAEAASVTEAYIAARRSAAEAAVALA